MARRSPTRNSLELVEDKAAPRPEWAIGFVYLIETDDRYQKIGYSDNPLRRVGELTKLPFEMRVAHQFPVWAKAAEGLLHRRYSHRLARGEWFILSGDDLKQVHSVREAPSAESLAAQIESASPLPPPIHPGSWEPIVTVPDPRGCERRQQINYYGQGAVKWMIRRKLRAAILGSGRELPEIAEASGVPQLCILNLIRPPSDQPNLPSFLHHILALAAALGLSFEELFAPDDRLLARAEAAPCCKALRVFARLPKP